MEKKSYEAPSVTVLGTVEQLTQSGNTGPRSDTPLNQPIQGGGRSFVS